MKASVFNNPMLGEGLSELVRAYIGDPEQEMRMQEAQMRNQINQLTLYEKAAKLGMRLPGMEGLELGGLVARAAGGASGGGGASGAGASTGTPGLAPKGTYKIKNLTASDLNNINKAADDAGIPRDTFLRQVQARAASGSFRSWSEATLHAAMGGNGYAAGPDDPINLPGEASGIPALPSLGQPPLPETRPAWEKGVTMPRESPLPEAPLGDLVTNARVAVPYEGPAKLSASDVALAKTLAEDAGVPLGQMLADVNARVAAGIPGSDAVAQTYAGIQPGQPGAENGWWPDGEPTPPRITPYSAPGAAVEPAPTDPAARVVGRRYSANGRIAEWTGTGWRVIN